MITKLSVRNFKSVRDLELDCTRVNLLIGAPGAGKSNILEALSFLGSTAHVGCDKLLRFEHAEYLFFDRNIAEPVSITVAKVRRGGRVETIPFRFRPWRDDFKGVIGEGNRNRPIIVSYEYGLKVLRRVKEFAFLRTYDPTLVPRFPKVGLGFLTPPDGSNLPHLLASHDLLREAATSLLGETDLKLYVLEDGKGIAGWRQSRDRTVGLPFSAASESVRRLLFDLAVIHTNRGASVVLREPETLMHPTHIQQVAEGIGRDRRNQYFITTNSPYLLGPIVEKTPAEELSVLAVHMRDHETRVRKKEGKQLSELLDMDPFLNLD